MPITSRIKISGSVTYTFDEIESIQRLRDVIRTGLNAMPSISLFAEDIEEFADELDELLKQYGE